MGSVSKPCNLMPPVCLALTLFKKNIFDMYECKMNVMMYSNTSPLFCYSSKKFIFSNYNQHFNSD